MNKLFKSIKTFFADIFGEDTPQQKTEEKAEGEKQKEKREEKESKDTADNKTTSTDKESSHTGEYLVCKGAKCKCDSSIEGTLVDLIIAQNKYLGNEDKPIATVRDNQFAMPFGSCKNLPYNPTCPYAPSLPWDVGEGLPFIGEDKMLPEKAELMCLLGGGKITVEIHGQTIEIGETDTQKIDNTIAAAVSPTTPFDVVKEEAQEDKKNEKLVAYGGIGSITLKKNEFCKEDISSKKGEWSSKEEIPLLTGCECTFIATPSSISATSNGTKWLIFHPDTKLSKTLTRENAKTNHHGIIYQEETLISGTELSLKFNTPGLYYIESFGGAIESKISSDCCLLVKVYSQNELREIKMEQDQNTQIITKEEELVLVRDKNYIFHFDFLFSLSQESKKLLRIEITDKNFYPILVPKIIGIKTNASGKMELITEQKQTKVQPAIYEGETEIKYHPINYGKHLLNIYWQGALLKSYVMDVLSTDKIQIVPSIELTTQRIRPNTPIHFTAKMDNTDTAVIWSVNDAEINEIRKGYTFQRGVAGEYVIQVRLKSILTKRIEGSYKLRVVENYVLELSPSTKNIEVGGTIDFSYRTAYDLNENEKIVVTLKITKPDKKVKEFKLENKIENEYFKFSLDTLNQTASLLIFEEGTHNIDFSIYKNGDYEPTGFGTPSINLTVKKINIKKWCFLNNEGKPIAQDKNMIGWGHNFGVQIQMDCNKPKYPTLVLSVYSKENDQFILLRSSTLSTEDFTGTLQFDDLGNASFWEQASKRNVYPIKLYFTLNSETWLTNGNLTISKVFNNAKDFKFPNKFCYAEKDVFIKTPDEAFFIGNFLDASGNDLYEIISYEQTAKIKIKLFPSNGSELDKAQFQYILHENKKDRFKIASSDDSIYTQPVTFENYLFEQPVLIETIKATKDAKQKVQVPRFFYFSVQWKRKSDWKFKDKYYFPYNDSNNDKFLLEFKPEDQNKGTSSTTLSSQIQAKEAEKQKLEKELKELLLQQQDYVGIFTTTPVKFSFPETQPPGPYIATPASSPSVVVTPTSTPQVSQPASPYKNTPAEPNPVSLKSKELNKVKSELSELSKQLQKVKEEEAKEKKNEDQVSSLGKEDVQRYYYQQLKIAEEPEVQNSVAKRVGTKVGGPMEGIMGKHVSGDCPRCNIDITLDDIRKICIDVKGKCELTNENIIKEALPFLNEYRKKVNLNSCSRKAHFLAQICAETRYSVLQENFNFSWPILLTKFKSYFNSFKETEKEKEAKRLGRGDNAPPLTLEQQIVLANAVYGPKHKYGSQHNEEGDGWRYSGKGFKQLTWKNNYKSVEEYFNKYMKNDIEPNIRWTGGDNPLKLAHPKDGILSALAFWGVKKIAYKAEGCELADLMAVSSIMTEATADDDIMKPRIHYFDIAKSQLQVDQCQKGSINMNSCNSTFDGRYKAEHNIAYINVITDKERNWQGVLVVFDNTGVLYKTYALCRGTNSNRVKAQGNGDTPTGLATTFYKRDHIGHLSFGEHGEIALIGKEGEFKTATNNGRTGILIHAGHTQNILTNKAHELFDDQGRLLNTFGCIRVYNKGMEGLVEIYNTLKSQGKTIFCYIEDYDGKIEDVFDFYNLNLDKNDIKRKQRSNSQ